MPTDISTASSLVIPQTAESTKEIAYSPAKRSPNPPEMDDNSAASPTRSGSLRGSATPADVPPRPISAQSPRDDDEVLKDEDSELSDTMSNADASGDAEYDLESPAPAAALANGRSATPDDRRAASKRKVGGIEVDEAIMANPELYGIRRSVREISGLLPMARTDFEQGRARLSTRLALSSEESDSDIAAPSRKRRKRTPLEAESPLSSPTPSASESDADMYATSRRKMAVKKKNGRSRPSASPAAPTHGELRFSTRNAAKVTRYNEDEDEDEFIDEDDATPAYYYAEEDTRPGIDAVLNHRMKDDVNPEKLDPGKADFEYFIKWQGKAHYHSTWEKFEDLTNCRGFRRLENYFRKIVVWDIHMQQDEDVPPEEKEKWSLDREREMEAVSDHTKVERVIDVAETDEGTQYLVKWKGLYYDSCTWENEELVSKIAQEDIDRYLDRTSRIPSSDRKESDLRTRSNHTALLEQPEPIKHGQLRDFQLVGLNWLCHSWSKGRSVILADEMGLGKTIQTISFMSWLKNARRQEGPFLVVVPLSTMPAWAESLDNWSPDINYVVYNGNEAARQLIREKELLVNNNPLKTKFNVLLTTYEYILADSAFLSQIKWQFLAVDEAHRLKNRESQLYVKMADFKAPARLLITGTPVQNNLEELSALMDFVAPGVVKIDQSVDMQSEEASEMIANITENIKPFIMRRTKTKVENDIPPKTEKIIRVELSDIQLEYYRNILTRNYAALNAGAKGQKQSLLNIMMELKKASNHPFMFPQAEDRILAGSERRDDVLKGLITSSGKMMLLDRLLSKLQKDGHRVLIFSQMVRMLDILSDYLRLRGYAYQRLDGNIAASQRRAAIEHFNAPESSDFCFLLSTRAGGLGINLMTADTVVLFDSDWNPQADLQAMARAHRIGQTRPVSIYRLVSKDTVEEEVLERARNKLMLEFITIQRGITDKEARELNEKMVKAGKGVAEPNSSEDISRILKRRGQKMFEQTGNQKKLEELDIDAVLENAEEHKTDQPEGFEADGGEEFLKSFEYVDVKVDLEWDDIIPKDQLEEIKEEEKRKADADYLAQVIEENKPRKRKANQEREERAAKKRARDLAVEAEESEPEHVVDPKRPLSERDTRNLIRGYLRYGDIEDRTEDVIREARLEHRDLDMLKAHMAEIKNMANDLQKDSDDRIKAQEVATQKSVTKKDRKAVLFDFNGVKRLNAETVIERPGEMRMLRDETTRVSDPRSYRVQGAQKGAQYSCEWGAREDGMLCVGIARHGYGAWPQIRDDPDLGLHDKFFLEEHRVDRKEERKHGDVKNIKSPGAVHLVRRADYLLSVLKERLSGGTNLAASRAVANHHRNHKRNTIRHEDGRGSSMSHSPAPGARRPNRDGRPNHRHRHSGDRRMSNGDHALDHRHRPDRQSPLPRHRLSESAHHRTEDRGNKAGLIKLAMERVMSNLDRVKNATKEKVPDKKARAAILRDELTAIGDFIKEVMMKNEDVDPRLESDVWKFVATWWPNPDTAGDKIRDMYQRLSVAKTTPAKEPRVNGHESMPKPQESPGMSYSKPEIKSERTSLLPPANGLTHALPPKPPPPAAPY